MTEEEIEMLIVGGRALASQFHERLLRGIGRLGGRVT